LKLKPQARGDLVLAEYSELFVVVRAKWLWTSKKTGPVSQREVRGRIVGPTARVINAYRKSTSASVIGTV